MTILDPISKEHHHDVLDIIAPDVLLDWAKRLGLTEGRKVLLENEHEMTLAEDLATYVPRPGRSHPLDRYARAAQFPSGSDEAIVLEAMRHARFSVWRVERRHETAGLILRDVLRGEEMWLVDETMEKNPPLGVAMAGRLLRPEGFAMTARIVVPVGPDLLMRSRTGSRFEAHRGGRPCTGPAFRDRHLPSRGGHGSDGLCPPKARIGVI